MVGKKKELSSKDLKKATGGARARGESGGTTPGGHGPRAGRMTKPPREGGSIQAKPRGSHAFENNDNPTPI